MTKRASHGAHWRAQISEHIATQRRDKAIRVARQEAFARRAAESRAKFEGGLATTTEVKP